MSLFYSTHEPGQSAEDERTTLDDYKIRMKSDQEGIYYLVGRNLSILKSSPKLEAFSEKGYEVLLLTDPVDEVIMSHTQEYKETKFIDAGTGQAASEEERKEAEKRLEALAGGFTPLKEKIMGALSGMLSDVRLSARMKSSPACLVGDGNAMSLQMEQLMRAMGQDIPPVKRILEVNPEHPVVRKLMDLAQAGDEKVGEFAEVLYDQALILEGASIADAGRFAHLLAKIMGQALGMEQG